MISQYTCLPNFSLPKNDLDEISKETHSIKIMAEIIIKFVSHKIVNFGSLNAISDGHTLK